MVEPLGNIPGHFHVLYLVTANGHIVGVENQNIRCHQYRVGKQAHGDGKIRILSGLIIGLHGSLVGMGTVHQSLGRTAVENPGQLRHLGDIRLSVEV